jgi:hypothetical protein
MALNSPWLFRCEWELKPEDKTGRVIYRMLFLALIRTCVSMFGTICAPGRWHAMGMDIYLFIPRHRGVSQLGAR